MKKISFVLIALMAIVTLSVSCKGSNKPVETSNADSTMVDCICTDSTVVMVDSISVDTATVVE